MATGGHAPPSSYSDRDEEPSRKYLVTKSFFDRLVIETRAKVRDLLHKLYEKGVITVQQKENVVKTLEQQHLEADYAPSLLFEIVIQSMENDDRNFDRLLLGLCEVELTDLADELYRASVSPPCIPTEQTMDHDGAHFSGGGSADALSKKKGEETSFYDSGIIAPQTFTISNSNSATLSDESPMFVQNSQQELVVNQPRLATTDQPYVTPFQESHSDSEEETTPVIEQDDVYNEVPMMIQPNNIENSLQSQPQLQEPVDIDETRDQQAPIQVHSEQSNALLLVPDANYASVVEEISGTSNSEEVVDHLSHRLTQMRLELQSKERELQGEAQQNSELLQRCQSLEEKVKKMQEEVETQKRQANKVSSDKDEEIISWKRKFEEKEREIRELRATIAQQELEKDALKKTHKAEIAKLQKQKKESAQKVADYENNLAALNGSLRAATQKKEEAEQQLKIAGSKMQEAVAERQKVENELLRSMMKKEEELSRLKEVNHKLELEIRELRYKNQSLAMEKKDQQVLLHKKDKELTEHKLVEAEKRHENCARELSNERRASQHLQDENHKLKRQLSEYLGSCSTSDSPAKRSRTD